MIDKTENYSGILFFYCRFNITSHGHHINAFVPCFQPNAMLLSYVLQAFWATQIEILWIQSKVILWRVGNFERFDEPPFCNNSSAPHFIPARATSLQSVYEVGAQLGNHGAFVIIEFGLGTKKVAYLCAVAFCFSGLLAGLNRNLS